MIKKLIELERLLNEMSEEDYFEAVENVLKPFELTKETFLENLSLLDSVIKTYKDMKEDLIRKYKQSHPCPYKDGEVVGDKQVVFTSLDLKTGEWIYPMRNHIR